MHAFLSLFRVTKPKTFADCVGNELPLGWEESYDPLIGPYYIDHINRKKRSFYFDITFVQELFLICGVASHCDRNKSNRRSSPTMEAIARVNAERVSHHSSGRLGSKLATLFVD